MKREFICMYETIENAQKKIRQWISSGYKIEIIAQDVVVDPNSGLNGIVISLWRWKEEPKKNQDKDLVVNYGVENLFV